MTYHDRLTEYLSAIGTTKSGVVNPDRKDNLGNILGDIYTWQTVKRLADKRLALAWADLQGKDGAIADDDTLREQCEIGELVLADTEHFTAYATVHDVRHVFDMASFIRNVAKRWKIREATLQDMAVGSTKPTKRVLSKRVEIKR